MGEYTTPGYTIISTQSEAPTGIPEGVAMLGAPLEWEETKGAGIRVAVIDTGAPYHPDVKVSGMVTFMSGADPYDNQGHGSHVAGIIAANGQIKGVAPEVQLYCLQVASGSSGGLSTAAIAKALSWCLANKMDVVNMSFGGPSHDPNIQAACKACYEAGIVLVAAAGNYGRDYGVLYPAAYPGVIGVAAVDVHRVRAEWSSVGPEVDVAANGVEVWSTWLSGGYALLAGTSMAAPHITGAAALLQAKALIREGKKDSPEVVNLMLRRYAEDLGIKGPDNEYGCGVFSFGRLDRPDWVKRKVVMKVGSNGYTVDGADKVMDVAPVLDQASGRVMVPVRFMAEGLGADVAWNGATREVTVEL